MKPEATAATYSRKMTSEGEASWAFTYLAGRPEFLLISKGFGAEVVELTLLFACGIIG
jgi:hypothetical protein